ncbi:hypothetical protein NHH03_13545 [Stieleria sp. TO1_6]|uniref:hypothetical protein n=1 Tax=Stieleria tagensis TaxID=2956795 RepID=UPI00209AADA6|nr:hypothetical protein [Stieleria tagensis]MCO8122766.1 hypothetical protein [Stieleria tagensis]
MNELPEASPQHTVSLAEADEQDPRSDLPPQRAELEQVYLQRLRELKLQLRKTRSEASAARLDARAAELELRIRRLSERGPTASDSHSSPTDIRFDHAVNRIGAPKYRLITTTLPFKSWDDFRRVIRSAGESPTASPPDSESPSRPRRDSLHRRDSAHPTPRRPQAIETRPLGKQRPTQTPPGRTPRTPDRSATTALIDVASAGETKSPSARRGKRRAWLLSGLVHFVLLVLLGWFTLSTTVPRDQIAIAGSFSETDQPAIESVQIESVEMPLDPTEPMPSETEYEISDVGEIAIETLVAKVPVMQPRSLAESMLSRQSISTAAMSLKSDSDAKIQFCGVEGGGNHFVYLVDSSGSMKGAFDSARQALLRSIEVLKPDQRFYVVFFDAESDYMRVSSPDQDEPHSVFATAKNKQALMRWAMSIQMDRGQAPYEPLEFAIELGPDVIFLLSDGEFPQKIEDLLGRINRVENLFGDSGPISIVHTIGYHSREGESRMKRIAQQNGGQYRHVPKP